jgi:hypothetical protein
MEVGTLSYRCACCGNEYSGAPSFSYETPPFIHEVPEEERQSRVMSDSDLCRVRLRPDENSPDDLFSIRVNLEIPIWGSPETFLWGVWVTQSEESFFRYIKTYEEDQSSEGSFGWLPVVMPHYREHATGHHDGYLACDVYWGKSGQRPTITLHECDHPLYLDQRDGISWERAVEIAQLHWQGLHGK